MADSKSLAAEELKSLSIEDTTDLVLRRGKIAVGSTHERFRPLRDSTKKKYIEVAEEWLKNGGNATKAYLSVYPNSSEKAAQSNGCNVMGHPEIQGFLALCWKNVCKQENVGPEYVLRELFNHSRVNMVDYLPDPSSGLGVVEHLKSLPKNVQKRLRAIDLEESEVPGQYGTATKKNLKVKGVDSQRAIEVLAKALGVFAEAEQASQRFDHSDMIERGVARLHTLGTLDTTKLYDEEGKLIEEGT